MTIKERTSADAAQASGDVTSVSAETTRTYGRFVVGANGKHIVSDTRATIGGPGDAIQAGELQLSALASCGLGLIQTRAKSHGVDLGEIGIAATFKRHADDPTRYEYIALVVTFEDRIGEDLAVACIAHFTGNCPIYNMMRRGGSISIERTARR